MEQIATLRERILAATMQVPWIPAMQKDSRSRSTHFSTAIEGNPLTLEQVRAVEEGREVPGVGTRAKREVMNYFAALRCMEKNAGKNRVTHQEILQLQKGNARNERWCARCAAFTPNQSTHGLG